MTASNDTLSRSTIFHRNIIGGLFCLTLAISLVADKIFSATAITLLLSGLWVQFKYRGAHKNLFSDHLKYIQLAFIAFVATTFLSVFIHWYDEAAAKKLGTHGRLLFFWPLLIVFYHYKINTQHIWIGFVSCSWISGAWALWELSQNTIPDFRANGSLSSIMFGNLALISAFITLIGAMSFWKNNQKTLFSIALIGIPLGLTAAFLSQTRSNFIALPVLLLLSTLLFDNHRGKALFGTIAVAAIIIIGAETAGSGRISNTVSNVLSGNLDKSTELRLIIWKEAWNNFTSNPIIGVGLQGYADSIISKASNGSIPEELAACCSAHAHNDIIFAMASRGLIGLLSMLAILIAPTIFFTQTILNAIRNKNTELKLLGLGGVSIVISYGIFGLTEAVFNMGRFTSVYVIAIAACIAAISNKHSHTNE